MPAESSTGPVPSRAPGVLRLAGSAVSVIQRRALFGVLSSGVQAGVTVLAAPPGSGKTVLLRSWLADGGLSERAAWVSVQRGEQDAQR